MGHPGVADLALLVVLLLSAAWCFFSLDLVIEAMVNLIVFVQFLGQSVGLMYYRWRVPKDEQMDGACPSILCPALYRRCSSSSFGSPRIPYSYGEAKSLSLSLHWASFLLDPPCSSSMRATTKHGHLKRSAMEKSRWPQVLRPRHPPLSRPLPLRRWVAMAALILGSFLRRRRWGVS